MDCGFLTRSNTSYCTTYLYLITHPSINSANLLFLTQIPLFVCLQHMVRLESSRSSKHIIMLALMCFFDRLSGHIWLVMVVTFTDMIGNDRDVQVLRVYSYVALATHKHLGSGCKMKRCVSWVISFLLCCLSLVGKLLNSVLIRLKGFGKTLYTYVMRVYMYLQGAS